MASITPSGSTHAIAPRKQTPAQNANAYAALKFGGSRLGIRDSANTATKITGSRNLPFILEILAETQRRFKFRMQFAEGIQTHKMVSFFGPCAPRTRMRSMSPVRLGPVMNEIMLG